MKRLLCKDFDIIEHEWNICCSGSCHQGQKIYDTNLNIHLITVYPQGIKLGEREVPDLMIGIRAEVCCGRFEFVRSLPRSWWIQQVGKYYGWSDEEIKSYAEAETYEESLKVFRGIAASGGFTIGKTSGNSNRGAIQVPKRIKTSPGACPSCGGKWDGFVCGNCGHS